MVEAAAVAVEAPMEADDGGTLLFELGIGEGVLPMLFLKMSWDNLLNRRADVYISQFICFFLMLLVGCDLL